LTSILNSIDIVVPNHFFHWCPMFCFSKRARVYFDEKF